MVRRYIIYCEIHKKNVISQPKHNFIFSVNLHPSLFVRVFEHNGDALSEIYDDMFRLLQKPIINQYKTLKKDYRTPTTKRFLEGDTSPLLNSIQIDVAINQQITTVIKNKATYLPVPAAARSKA